MIDCWLFVHCCLLFRFTQVVCFLLRSFEIQDLYCSLQGLVVKNRYYSHKLKLPLGKIYKSLNFVLKQNTMRIVVVLMLAISISACNEELEITRNDMLEGKWQITHKNGERVTTKEGLFFAPNKQYFEIDSQGKPIPRLMEKIWKLEGDTLQLIDFNWEPEFIDKKGTFYYFVEELTSDKMTLTLTRTKESKTVSYKKNEK